MRTFKLSFLLAVLLSMVGANVFAYDIALQNSDRVTIYYNFINDKTELEVTYSSTGGNSYSGNVNIPSSVLLMDGSGTRNVTSIGERAFVNCSGLTSVTIPNGVRTIGNQAFAYCSLSSVNIPSSTTSIGSSAFEGCSGLESVTIGNSVTSIGNSVFSGCSSLSSISIPNSVISLGISAFKNCSSLSELNIPNGVMEIGDSAFEGCTALTSVTIPNSVTSIGKLAFSGCTGLKDLTISDGTEMLNFTTNVLTGLAFYNCSIEKIYLGRDISNSPFGSMKKDALKTLVIGDDVTTIVDYTFQNCSELSQISIGNSVTSIGYNAFYGCSSLTSLALPNSVTSIGNQAFYGCNGLTELLIPDNVTEIGYEAFRNCTGLTKVTIGDNVTSIGYEAFRNCTDLTKVTIGGNVTSIGYCAFWSCKNLAELIISDGTEELNMASISSSSYPRINTPFDGCPIETLYLGRDVSWTHSAFSEKESLKTVTLGDNVTTIRYETFWKCSGLTDLTIGNGVTLIGQSAFYNCSSLTKLTVPNSVVSIGSYAFYGCGGLTEVTLGENITSIDENGFYGCSSLASVTSFNTTPPTIVSSTFSTTAKGNATLYVPEGTKEEYQQASGWSAFSNIEEMTSNNYDEITLSSIGKGTYCSEYDLDFTDVEGLKAYIASGYDYATGTVLLTNVKEVPAGTGVMLIGTEGTYQVPYCSEKSQYYYLNMLKGIQQAQTVPQTEDGYTNYILKDGDEGVLFYKVTGQGTVAAHRAYLQIPTVEAEARPMLNFMIDDETTGTETTGLDATLMNNGERTNKAFYNLNGQCVEHPKQGIYIQNGKKIIIR